MEYSKKIDNLKTIDKDYSSDVLIIGAGLTGLTTSYYLTKNGLNSILVDISGIGEKASGHTTAKITSMHNLIYNYLAKSFDEKFAIGYYRANEEAISNIKQIIDLEKIECDFEFVPNYIYTENQDEIVKIQDELKTLKVIEEHIYNLNEKKILPTNAEFVDKSSLPFKIAGALKTYNQAQFHPVKYMEGLARAIQTNGGNIFINSKVTDVKKEGEEYISIVNNHKIKSKYVVFACHYPFKNFPGFYFSKMYQSSSYAIAIETDKELPDGMYINIKEPILSFRTVKYNKKRLLIISGGDHKTGYDPNSSEKYGYNYLEQFAKKHYSDCKIKYKWNTRDAITLDKVPYVGEYSEFMKNAYVATGFNKWGMTSSNVAANIICDKILGKENKYENIFNSKRLEPIKNKEEFGNMLKQVVKSFTTNRLKIPEDDIGSIDFDNGGIIKIDGIPVGIYKNKNGKIYAINPTCTHLGCLLTWNNLDKTWDCPCHGSRFNFDGKNLYDPAFKDLEVYDLE